MTPPLWTWTARRRRRRVNVVSESNSAISVVQDTLHNERRDRVSSSSDHTHQGSTSGWLGPLIVPPVGIERGREGERLLCIIKPCGSVWWMVVFLTQFCKKKKFKIRIVLINRKIFLGGCFGYLLKAKVYSFLERRFPCSVWKGLYENWPGGSYIGLWS